MRKGQIRDMAQAVDYVISTRKVSCGKLTTELGPSRLRQVPRVAPQPLPSMEIKPALWADVSAASLSVKSDCVLGVSDGTRPQYQKDWNLEQGARVGSGRARVR